MRRLISRSVLTAATIISIAAGWVALRSQEHLTEGDSQADASVDLSDTTRGTQEEETPRASSADGVPTPTTAPRITTARPRTRTRMS